MSEILSSKDVVTRKPHKCFGCNKIYPVKTSMCRQAIQDCGTVFTSYLCDTCEEVIARTFECGDEFGEGELYDGDPDYWDDVHRTLHPEVSP